jgi:predicted nuclease with TOPRIM domain
MTVRTGPLLQPFFLQPPDSPQNSFKNHQKWEIARDPDFSTGSPLLQLKDPHGITHEVKDFILENLDSNFEEALTRVTTPESKEQIICEYLCQRLANATSFQVHVETFCDEETHKSHYCLRLGGHGLKGGGKDDELLGGGKKTALGLSAAQICAGVIIIAYSRKLKLSSSVLLSMGTAGVSYHLKTNQKFTWSQWSAHTAFGVISGLVSGACDYLSKGANIAMRVFTQTVGTVVGNGASNAIAYRLEDKPLDKKFVQSMGMSAVGGLVNASTGEVFNIFRPESEGLLNAVGFQAFKGMVSSLLSKSATHYYEGKEMVWQDYMEAVLLGGGLSALTAFAEFWRSSNKLQELQGKKTKVEKQLAETKDRHTANELTAQQLSERLRQSGKKLALKQEVLKTLENKQTETSFNTLQESIEAAREEVSKILKQITQDESSFASVIQACEAIAQQLPALSRIEQHLKKSYEKLSQNFENKIRAKLDKGAKVKINGRAVKDPATIREALVNGERVKWAMKGASSGFYGTADRLFDKFNPLRMNYRRGLHRLSHEMRALIRMEDQIEHYQTELGIAADLLRHSEGSLSDFPTTSAASNNPNSSSSAETQATQDYLSQQISNLKLQMSELQAQLPEARQQVELGRAHIAKLEGEINALGHNIKDISIENARTFQDNNSAWLPKGEINFKPQVSESPPVNAFKPKPVVSIPPEEALKELIEHVVLVQAISPGAFSHYPEADWDRADNDSDEAKIYKAVCSLKGVLNRQGVVGHHLEFAKKEFREKLIDRPHSHWSWNQLVQPHPRNSWEDAGVAMLEPLATVENTIHHKPFGIAPYDTLILGPHRLSPKSILLIPQSIAAEATEYLKDGFQGEIVTYDWTTNSLRKAIIDTVEKKYPETWQVCDQQGSSIGKEKNETAAGYNNKNYLRKTEGEVFLLMENGGSNVNDQLAPEMKYYRDVSRRMLCLHVDAPTASLEHQIESIEIGPGRSASIPTYFGWLSRFTVGIKQDLNKNPFFVGGVEKTPNALKGLGILKVLEIYVAMQHYHPATGASEWGHYYLSEAMRADLISLLRSDEDAHLSHLQCVTIFNSTGDLIEALLTLDKMLKAQTPDSAQKAVEAFDNYCSLLKDRLVAVRKATQQAANFLMHAGQDSAVDENIQHPCLSFGQQEWNQVTIPENGEITLEKNWPRTDAHYAYVYKLARILPKNPEELKDLHFKLSKIRHEDKKEQYRVNLICSVIYGLILNQCYLHLRPSEAHSIIADRILKEAGWLTKYHLKIKDFTRKENIGDCLFENIAGQLPEGVSLSQELRQKVVQFMKDNSQTYRPFFAAKLATPVASLADNSSTSSSSRALNSSSVEIMKEPASSNLRDAKLLVGDGDHEKSLTFENWADYLDKMGKPQVWATTLEIRALADMLKRPIILLQFEAEPFIYNETSQGEAIFIHHLNDNHFESCIPIQGQRAQDIFVGVKNEIKRQRRD